MAPLDCRRIQKNGIVPRPVLERLCKRCAYNKPESNYDIFDFNYVETENSGDEYQYIVIAENGCNFRLEKAENSF